MPLIEHKGKSPCIADHRGQVLWFADEDKTALKGHAPPKKTHDSRGGSKAKALAKVSVSDNESDASNSDPSSSRPTTKINYIPTGAASPSGNARKRARIAKNPSRSQTSGEASYERLAGKPHTTAIDASGKRKRLEVMSPSPDDDFEAGVSNVPQDVGVPPMPIIPQRPQAPARAPFAVPGARNPPIYNFQHQGPPVRPHRDPGIPPVYGPNYANPAYPSLPHYPQAPMYSNPPYGAHFYHHPYPEHQQWQPPQAMQPWMMPPPDFPPENVHRVRDPRGPRGQAQE